MAIAAAAPAGADAVASVTSATWHESRLTLNVLAKSVPRGIDGSLVAANVTVAGTTVAAQLSYAATDVPDTSTVQTVMLVIDASGSMTGERQAATTKAVSAFLDAAPLSAEIGVVAFSGTARLVTRPTSDHAAVLTAVQGLKPSGDTALYDAVGLAASVLGNRNPCTMLVLSDGEDTSSRKSLAQVEAALTDSQCTASFVGLRTNPKAFASMEELAAAGRGRAFKANDAQGISGVFIQSFTTTNASIAIVADFPIGFADRNRAISIDLALADLHVGLTARARAVDEPVTNAVTSATIMSLAAIMFVSVFLLIWLLTEGTDRARRRRVDALITEYAMRRVESSDAVHEDTVIETLEDLIRPALAKTKYVSATAVEIDGAGLDVSVELWTLIRIALGLVLAGILGVATGGLGAALLLGLPLGLMLPQMWLSRLRAKRSRNFEQGLPDALMLMASSLRSGFSLDQAIVATCDQADSEVAVELRRAVQEIRIGAPLESALERIAVRMASADFQWVVTALRIQRKSGGNLAELLITVSHTVRQRAQMSREVAALTAEGRLSAYVLIGLPIALFGFLLLTQPTYLEPLYKTTIGITITIIGAVMLLVGWLLMKKLVQVDV